MNEIDSIIENSELLAKKLTGQLSKDEAALFNQWLSSSKRNQLLFKKLQENKNFLARNELFEQVNTEKGWENLAEKLNFRRKTKYLNLFVKYAAAILLPVIIGTSLYWYFTEKPATKVIQVSEIKHGEGKASLVLNNGQKINLDSKETDILKETDGTIIDKTANGLNYTRQHVKESNIVLQNTLVVPRGSDYSLILSDGTKVFVNSMSKLVFPVRFTGENREVTLEGEAYFEVQKDAAHPFVLNVNGIKVNVLGTSFNVKAYPDESHISTTLVEGKVKIDARGLSGGEWELNPDQQAVFDRSNAGLSIQKVDAKQFIQWTTGKCTFTNQTLDEIMKILSRWYDFTYSYSDESLKTIRFEGGLNKYDSIGPVLDIINKTRKVKVSVNGKEVLFSRIGQ